MMGRHAHFFRARAVAPVASPPIEDGAVVLRDGRVVAVGPFAEVRAAWPEGSVTDLGDQVILPGLINAHCHLDYTGLRGRIPPPSSFTDWIGAINEAKRGMTETDYREAIAAGYEELRRWGTTSVFNLAAEPLLLHGLPEPEVRTWWAPEMYDLRRPASELIAEAKGTIADFQLTRPESRVRFALSPHSPYTASAKLYGRCAEEAGQRDWLLSTHVAESPEEAAMFREGKGALYDLLASVGRPMDDLEGPIFSSLAKRGLIAPGWLLAHGNELEEADFELIEASHATGADRWSFVHCPRSHAYFGHRQFPWQRLQEVGARVILGTDSLASNDALNLFAEMRAARAAHPWLTPEQLLRTVTMEAAAALGMAGELGEITPGARADLIALPFQGQIDDLLPAILEHDAPVVWQMLETEQR